MKSFFLLATLTFLTALMSLNPAVSEPDLASHLKAAREHINVAVQEGSKGNSNGLVQHAEVGLEHARMA